MPLSGAILSGLIKAQLLSAGVANEDNGLLQATCDSIGENVVDHVKDNQLVLIPAGSVIIAVSGGAGSPAIGIPNPAPITCTVS